MRKIPQKKVAVILFAAAIMLILALGFLLGAPLIRYASEPWHFRAWVDEHGILGRIVYIVIVLFQVVVALIPGEPFEILGGYAFGALEGTLLCLAATWMGSVAVFALVRRYGISLARVFFSEEKLESARFLHSSPRRDLLFLLIFMLPGTPKDLLSYFAGLTDIKFGTWLLICTIGRIPSVISSTYGGSALGEKNYLAAAIVFALSFVLSAAGMLVYKKISQKRKNSATDVKDNNK